MQEDLDRLSIDDIEMALVTPKMLLEKILILEERIKKLEKQAGINFGQIAALKKQLKNDRSH